MGNINYKRLLILRDNSIDFSQVFGCKTSKFNLKLDLKIVKRSVLNVFVNYIFINEMCHLLSFAKKYNRGEFIFKFDFVNISKSKKYLKSIVNLEILHSKILKKDSN